MPGFNPVGSAPVGSLGILAAIIPPDTVPTPTPTVTAVSVTPATATLAGGSTLQLNAVATGTNSPPQTFNWSRSPAKGSVNSSGFVTLPASTTAQQTITVTAASTLNPNATDTCVITIPAVLPDIPGDGRTVRLTVLAMDQQGNLMAGAPVTAVLNKVDVDPDYGFISPEEILVFANEDGVAILDLWPNVRGIQESQYIIVIENPDTGAGMRVDVTVPAEDCILHEIALPKE